MTVAKLKVTFILPGAGYDPVGGFKVVYEYANRLVDRGHRVSIVHAAQLRQDTSLKEKIRRSLYFYHRKATGRYHPNRWFSLNPEIQLFWLMSLNRSPIPDADVVIASSWETAECVNRYPDSKGRRFYLIQGLETWSGPKDRVLGTWKMPLHKIIISKWLADMAKDLGVPFVYIPNGLDFKAFGIDVPPRDRYPTHVHMLYHELELKGSADGLKALEIAKRAMPDLRATLFGVSAPPPRLPKWIEYHRRPSQQMLRQLYNRAAIFLSPSWSEGWPLPPAEAMICGAALVATDIGGHREYASHEQTALLSPPKDPARLADTLLRLLRDPELRIKLAMAGNSHIRQFTWDRAADALEGVLATVSSLSAAISPWNAHGPWEN
jgi:glycosyltransferase involved in cell wall biosynthesis